MEQIDFAIATTTQDSETTVVSAEGEVDIATAPRFEEELCKAVELEARRVVVDPTATTFFDSSAIHALLSGAARLQRSGAQVCVVCNDPNIRRLFEITRVDRMLQVHATIEQATGSRLFARHATRQPGDSHPRSASR